MHRTIADANLIKIHAELNELLGKQVQVCKCIVGSRKVQASEMEKKKTTSAPNDFIEERTL